MEKCPDLNYPAEFIFILFRFPTTFDCEGYIIPDGASLQDLLDNLRLSYLRDQVEIHFTTDRTDDLSFDKNMVSARSFIG